MKTSTKLLVAAMLFAGLVMTHSAVAADRFATLEEFSQAPGTDKASQYVHMPFTKAVEAINVHQAKCVNENGRPKMMLVVSKVRIEIEQTEGRLVWMYKMGYGEGYGIITTYEIMPDGDGSKITAYGPTGMAAKGTVNHTRKIIESGGLSIC